MRDRGWRRSQFFKHRGLNCPSALRRGWCSKPVSRDDVPGLRPLEPFGPRQLKVALEA